MGTLINSNNIMQELGNIKNWKKTHKKSYSVYMCRPLPGTQCTNRLEGAHYVTDKNKQFILSGTVGETWVIDVNKLARTYTFADGTPITPETLKAKCREDGQIEWTKITTRTDATPNWAFFLPKTIQNFPVNTSWGDTLLANRNGVGHLQGDFLVCSDNGGKPNLNDVWVVNGDIFPRTYDLHGFPNMFSAEVSSAEPVKPVQSFNKKKPITSKADKDILALANGLKQLGHRIGKLQTNEVLNKSFKMDNGAYGVLLQSDESRGTYVKVFGNTANGFREILGFFLEDDTLENNVKRIHSVVTGSKKPSDIADRAINNTIKDTNAVFANGEEPEVAAIIQAHNNVFKVLNTLSKTGLRVSSSSDTDLIRSERQARIDIDSKSSANYVITDITINGGTISYMDAESNELYQSSIPPFSDKAAWKNELKNINSWIKTGNLV